MWPMRSKTSVAPLGATSTDIQLPSLTSNWMLRASAESGRGLRAEQADVAATIAPMTTKKPLFIGGEEARKKNAPAFAHWNRRRPRRRKREKDPLHFRLVRLQVVVEPRHEPALEILEVRLAPRPGPVASIRVLHPFHLASQAAQGV